MVHLKQYAYPYDPTGRNPTNLIKSEIHTITPENRARQNIIVPKYAPFYKRSLKVIDMTSGHPLIETIDYTVEWPVEDSASATEGNQTLYSAIQFIDSEITGNFSITYHTIGGSYAFPASDIARALANQANDPLKTTWGAIIGKPLVLPPLEHVHSIRDFVGFDAVVAKLDELRVTIELLAREDRDSHPGYDTLTDEYFRLSEELAKLKLVLNNSVETNNQANADLSERLIALINQTVNNVNQQLAEQNENNDRALQALRQLVTNNINAIRTELTDGLAAYKIEVNNKLTEQNTSINNARKALETKAEETKHSLTTLINTAKSDLERQFNTFKATTEQTVNTLNTTITNINTALGQRITTEHDKNTQQDTTLNNHGQRITTIENTIRGGGDFVRTVSDQNIDGTKTFIKPIKLTNSTDSTKEARIGYSQNDVYIYNHHADKYLSLRNDGTGVYYGGKKLAYEETLNTTKNELNTSINNLRTSLSSDYVTLNTEQKITARKNYTGQIRFLKANDESKYASMGFGDSDFYITNNVVAKPLRLHNDGRFTYDNKNVILQDVYDANNTRINNLIQVLQTTIGSGDFVRTSGDQIVNGEKKFKGAVFVRKTDDDNQVAKVMFNNIDLTLYNPISNKYLQLRNTGGLEYDNKRVLLQPDYDELNRRIQIIEAWINSIRFEF